MPTQAALHAWATVTRTYLDGSEKDVSTVHFLSKKTTRSTAAPRTRSASGEARHVPGRCFPVEGAQRAKTPTAKHRTTSAPSGVRIWTYRPAAGSNPTLSLDARTERIRPNDGRSRDEHSGLRPSIC